MGSEIVSGVIIIKVLERVIKKPACIMFLLLAFVIQVQAQDQQVTGRILDSNGDAIPFASVSYKGHHIAVSSDADGKFDIERHVGWNLTLSCLGYKSKIVKITDDATPLSVTLKEDSRSLGEVVVKSKRGHYHRKDNPAVELMRRVIAAKKRTDLRNHDFYQYDKYQKITLAINDLKPEQLKNKFFSHRKYMRDQVEVSPYNHKLVLPLSVDETVSQHIYRKNPLKEKDIIMGHQSSGIGKLLQTGASLNKMLKDFFTDVDIYDDDVRILQFPFPSPIGNTAISFYHFYIEDTVYVDRDKCIHLQFIPANSQDLGFRGEIWVLDDSTLHVKKCNLFIPHNSDIDWVDDMKIEQEYTRLSNGDWVLTKDDMIAEMRFANFLSKALVVRNTRLSNYSFEDLPSQLFKGRALVKHDINEMNRDENFWNQYRAVGLTKSESSMNSFINRMTNSHGWKYVITAVKVFAENYMETGSRNTPSKFDLGPLNTYLSSNYVDGLRMRLAGRSTAAFNPHLFFDGYGAYGMKSNKWYYGAKLSYAFNKKQHSSFEFPQRNIEFETTSDVMSDADRNLIHNKDNVFMTIRSSTEDQMFAYNRQRLSGIYETDWGFSVSGGLQTESNTTAGNLHYYYMPKSPQSVALGTDAEARKIRMSDVDLTLHYNPGVTFVNTKQQRFPVNLDSPDFYISQSLGLRHFLGGQFSSSMTEAGIYKRFWLGSWGCVDTHLTAKAQWKKVPFPMLVMPPYNMSYFMLENTFSMMRDWEFINDRQLFWSAAWDMNGKILNRIPLVRRLHWREYFAIKGMIGHLTEKNNPFLEQNQTDPDIYQFPTNAHVMTHQPYWEASFGVRNILNFFTVEFVRRLTYLNDENIHKWGVRFSFDATF